MPIVPRITSPQVQESALPNARSNIQTSAESFGGGQSGAAVNEAVQGTLSVASKYLQDEKKKADETAFLSADQKLSELETGIQVKTSRMYGKDALGAPDSAQADWKKGLESIQSGLSNDEQRMAIAKASSQRWESLNKNVQMHTAGQAEVFADQTTSAYIDTSRSAAVLNSFDDSRVQQELDRQRLVTQDWAKRKGVSGTEVEKAKIQDTLSSTHVGVIQARLDNGQEDKAKEYFDQVKDVMSAKDSLTVQKAVMHAELLKQGLSTWDEVKGMNIPGSLGVPDEAKMQAHVMAMDGVSTDQKLKIWDFVKARAGEEQTNNTRQTAARDRSFLDTTLQGRQQGTSLEDALKVAQKSGRDEYEKSMNAEAVRKIYAPTITSDPEQFVAMREGIMNGGFEREKIDDAFKANKLSVEDWKNLRNEYYKVNVEGSDPATKYTWDRIKQTAEADLGSDKKKQAEFLYDMHISGKGKSPEELTKMAKDKLEGAPGSGWFGSDWFKDPQYKVDVQKSDAQNLAWGKVYQDVGQSETVAIGRGALSKGAKTWGLADVDSFAQSMGGYDKIKPGSVNHNAMQSLMKRNQVVTPANVNAVLAKFPDGKW